MTEEMNTGPKARGALQDFDRILDGPPHCQPTWEGDLEHLIEWATDFVTQEKKNKEEDRVTGDAPEETEPVDGQEPDRQQGSERTQPSDFLDSDEDFTPPDWAVTYALNAKMYPRLEILVRSILDVKMAAFQDQIDERMKFIDSVLNNPEGHDVPHEEEFSLNRQRLLQMKTYLDDTRENKAYIDLGDLELLEAFSDLFVLLEQWIDQVGKSIENHMGLQVSRKNWLGFMERGMVQESSVAVNTWWRGWWNFTRRD